MINNNSVVPNHSITKQSTIKQTITQPFNNNTNHQQIHSYNEPPYYLISNIPIIKPSNTNQYTDNTGLKKNKKKKSQQQSKPKQQIAKQLIYSYQKIFSNNNHNDNNYLNNNNDSTFNINKDQTINNNNQLILNNNKDSVLNNNNQQILNNNKQQFNNNKYEQTKKNQEQIKHNNNQSTIKKNEQVTNNIKSYVNNNVLTTIHDNKLYVIGQMNPQLYKYQRYNTQITNPYLLQILAKMKYTPKDDPYQKCNNTIQIPIYLFQQQLWTINKIKISSFEFLGHNYKFIHPSRQPTKQQLTVFNASTQASSQAYNGWSSSYSSFKKSQQKQKPILYFPNQLTHISSCKDIQNPKYMYLFGGVNQQKLAYSNKLWKLNLDDNYLQLIQAKGDIPNSRQGATLTFYNSNWLVLYGGYNLYSCQVFNQFYMYSLNNNLWTIIQNDFQKFLSPRINYSLSFNRERKSFYLFGGMIYNYNNEECLLDDMYEMRLCQLDNGDKKNKDWKKIRFSLQIRELLPKQYNKWPQSKHLHRSQFLNQNLLLLIGGQTNNNFNNINNVSTYNKDKNQQGMDIQCATQNNSLQIQSINSNQFNINNILNNNNNNNINNSSNNNKNKNKILSNNIWIFDIRTQQWSSVLAWNIQNPFTNILYFSLQPKLKLHHQFEFILFHNHSNSIQQPIQYLAISTHLYQQAYSKYKPNLKYTYKYKQQYKPKSQPKPKQQSIHKQLTNNPQLPHKQQPQYRQKQIEFSPTCQWCIDKKLLSQTQKYIESQIFAPEFPLQMIQSYVFSGMPFAFTAFGLISTFSVNKQASKLNISYSDIPLVKHANYILFEDDGYLTYTAAQIAQKIHKFTIHDPIQTTGISDKKYKALHTKFSHISRFCNTLKLAGLRLGQQLLWISINTHNQILVYWLRRQSYHNGLSKSSQHIYKSYFYALDQTTLQVIAPYSQKLQKFVVKHNEKMIQQFMKQKKNIKSILKISRLRRKYSEKRLSHVYQLAGDFNRNTILINEDFLYDEWKYDKSNRVRNRIIQQSIDINLRAFLSMYYLRRQIKISLKVNTTGYPPGTTVIVNKPIINNSNRNNNQNSLNINNSSNNNSNSNNSNNKSNTYQKGTINISSDKNLSIDNSQESNNNNNKVKPSTFVLQVQQFLKSKPNASLICKNHSHLLKQPVLTIDKQQSPTLNIIKKQQTQINIIKQQNQIMTKKQTLIITQNQTNNKMQQINFQFMLPKIDQKLSKRQLIEIDLDAFGQFDCKIIQVYYSISSKQIDREQTQKKSNKNKKQTLVQGSNNNIRVTNSNSRINLSIQPSSMYTRYKQQDTIFSNGLLIYHRGHFVKRYKFDIGMLFTQHYYNQLNKNKLKYLQYKIYQQSFNKQPHELQSFHQLQSNFKQYGLYQYDQLYRALNQYNMNIFGLIQVNDKYVQNVFGNNFINDSLLQKLYERIQNISMLYQKMEGNWFGSNIGKRSRALYYNQQNNQEINQQINQQDNQQNIKQNIEQINQQINQQIIKQNIEQNNIQYNNQRSNNNNENNQYNQRIDNKENQRINNNQENILQNNNNENNNNSLYIQLNNQHNYINQKQHQQQLNKQQQQNKQQQHKQQLNKQQQVNKQQQHQQQLNNQQQVNKKRQIQRVNQGQNQSGNKKIKTNYHHIYQ